jgi:ABC-2 type transport system ATP-binding protein
MAPTLSFHHISKRYGKAMALDNVSLDIEQGEIFGLVGANGAGKTTLIKCLLDFCEPDNGTIEISGIDHHETRSRRDLAYLPESFAPPHYLTGKDFLQYMLKLQGLDYDATGILNMLAALDLEPDSLGKPVRAYSKGMTQKLGLAGCFLRRRNLYILDEPMSGLDPKARALLKRRILQSRGEGATFFFTSHTLPDVEELCGRMAILHGGRLRFCGTPAECRSAYDAATLEEAYMACINPMEEPRNLAK